MSKQYIKCLTDEFGYFTTGKMYEVHRFNEHDSDIVYITDDEGDEVSVWVTEGQFEVFDTYQQSAPQKSGVLYNGILYETSDPDEMIEIANAIFTLNKWPQSTI